MAGIEGPQMNPRDVLILGKTYAAMELFRAGQPPEMQPDFDAYTQAVEDMVKGETVITLREVSKKRGSSKITRAQVVWTPPGSLPETVEDAFTQLVLTSRGETFDAATRRVYINSATGAQENLPGPGIFFDSHGEGGQITIIGRTSAGIDSRRKISGVLITRPDIARMRERVVVQAVNRTW